MRQRLVERFNARVGITNRHDIDAFARVDIRVPPLTFINTKPEFAWLVTYIETLFSCELWKPSTVATIAFEYCKRLTYFARLTGSPIVGLGLAAGR